MKQVIFKNTLEFTEEQEIYLPIRWKYLDIQIQNDKPVIWTMHDINHERMNPVKVYMFFTGWIFEVPINSAYHATLQNNGLVWHVFIEFVI
jgi:hypothetical protein